MNKAKFRRTIRGSRTLPAITSQPTVEQVPVITSETPGVYEVGKLLTASPSVFNGATSPTTRKWFRGASEIPLIVGATYRLTQADADLMIRVEDTASNAAGSATAISVAVGPVTEPVVIPPTDPGAAYEGVSTESLAHLELVKSTIAAEEWEGFDVPVIPPERTFTVTSASALVLKVNQIPRANTGADMSLWYDIILDSTVPQSNWTNASISLVGVASSGATTYGPIQPVIPGGVWDAGHYYGSYTDRSTFGGGIRIRSSNPANMVNLSNGIGITGLRGILFEDVIISKRMPPGSVDTVLQACVGIGSSGTYRDMPVVNFLRCKIGTKYHPLYNPADPIDSTYVTAVKSSTYVEQIFLKDCDIDGAWIGMTNAGPRRIKTINCDYQSMLADNESDYHQLTLKTGNSNWDECVYHYHRLDMIRNSSEAEIASLVHADGKQKGTGADKGNYMFAGEFLCFYQQRVEGTDGSRITPGTNNLPLDGETVTIKGETVTYRNNPTLPNEVQIGATVNSSLEALQTYFRANPVAGQVSAANAGIYFEIHFPYGESEPFSTTWSGATLRQTRIAGGNQGWYMDDLPAAHRMDGVLINCIIVPSVGRGIRFYNGWARAERCILGSPGLQPPDATVANAGFDFPMDYVPFGESARKAGANTDHTFRRCVFHHVLTGVNGQAALTGPNQTFVPVAGSVIKIEDCEAVDWKATSGPTSPMEKLAGNFYVDAQGRVAYDFDNSGTNTRQQFRQALYDQLKLADPLKAAISGCTNPNTWPTE